jgi:hypothetical protein
MPISTEAKKVVAAFQRYKKTGDKAQIEDYPIEELRQTNYQLGNRDVNAGWRLAILDRISELEKDDEKLCERQHKSKMRGLKLILVIIAGLVIIGLGRLLFGN